MKYIVASDFDGTLMQNGCVSPRTVTAIEKFRKEGNFFGVVTGRDYVFGYKVFKKYKLFPFDFVVTHNGASACDKDGNIYFAEHISGGMPWGNSTLAQELIKRCFELSCTFCGIAFEQSRLNFHLNLPHGGKDDEREYSDYAKLKDVGDFVMSNLLCTSIEEATQITKILKEEFGSVLNPLQNGRCIDVTAIGVDKASGIARLARILKIPTDNIWTAGDNYNDIPMLREYHGCAMASGVEELSEIAEHVCEEVADVIDMIIK